VKRAQRFGFRRGEAEPQQALATARFHFGDEPEDPVVATPDRHQIPRASSEKHQGIEDFFVQTRRLSELGVPAFHGSGEPRPQARVDFGVAREVRETEGDVTRLVLGGEPRDFTRFVHRRLHALAERGDGDVSAP
jgi:hypothetical protein